MDGRDALTGRPFNDGERVNRHHYEILYVLGSHIEFIKYDCRLQALVPLSDSSHGSMNNAAVARSHTPKFKEAMEKWLNGEWYIPKWWLRASYKKEFANHLRSLGFRENP